MDIIKYLEKNFKYYDFYKDTYPNQYKVYPIDLKFTDEDVKTFNFIYKSLYKHKYLMQIKRGLKGTISRSISNYYCGDVTGINLKGLCVKLTIIVGTKIGCIRIGRPTDFDGHMPGHTAFTQFKKLCESNGINLDDYALTDKEEIKRIKESIDKPLISMTHLDEELDNVHHIDFHSSYPAGLCNTHPEFKAVIEPLYNERKDPKKKDINKSILNLTIGYLQSYHKCGAKWVQLSYDAIHDNNVRVLTLATMLRLSGREIIGYNTDGIWYRGDIYHESELNEGPNLGQWQNDHINCHFRAKSRGVYEYIEDDQYHVAMRGISTYEAIKPRKDWEGGDIYKGSIRKYDWEEGYGLRRVEDEI